MLDFTQDEIALLLQDGYTPGFIMDIQEDDLVAIPPVLRNSFAGDVVPCKTVVIQRIVKVDGAYYDYRSDEVVPNTVVCLIGLNLDNLPEHLSYGGTYPCFIKRQVL